MTIECDRDRNIRYTMRKQTDSEDIEAKTDRPIDSNASAGFEYEEVLELIGMSSLIGFGYLLYVKKS